MNLELYKELVRQINSLQKQIDALVKPEVSLSSGLWPLFSAIKSAVTTDVTGDGTTYSVICDTEIVDRNSNYDNTTGTFTAPVDGFYLLKFHCLVLDLLSTHTNGQAIINTSNRDYYGSFINPYALSTGGFCPLWCECIADMDAGDTAVFQIQVSNGTKVVDVYGNSGLLHTRVHGGLFKQ